MKVEATPPALSEYSGEALKTPARALPASVRIYLDAAPGIELRDARVKKVAAQLRAFLDGDEDPGLADEAVELWTESELGSASSEKKAPRVARWRAMDAGAAKVVERGWGSDEEKVRVRVALLRSLGVPARECRFRGVSGLQYWAGRLDDAADKQKRSAATIRGEWVLSGARFPGESADAASMDAAPLEPLIWDKPATLAVQSAMTRAYYFLSESTQAQADFDFALDSGRLPLGAAQRSLPPRSQSYLLLALHAASLSSEGPLPELRVECLQPYTANLRSWGEESFPEIRRMEILRQGLWSDRVGRIRLRARGVEDEWKSPPPANGMLHYLAFNLRRPASILVLQRSGAGELQGSLYRTDTGKPRGNTRVEVEFQGPKNMEPQQLATDSNGGFLLKSSQEEGKGSSRMVVSGGFGEKSVQNWDALSIALGPENGLISGVFSFINK